VDFLRSRKSSLVAQGRTVAEALDIARDVARKLIEARRERDGVPSLPTTSERRDDRSRRVNGAASGIPIQGDCSERCTTVPHRRSDGTVFHVFRENPTHLSLQLKKLDGEDHIYSARIGLTIATSRRLASC
jgi:hypothetical protein